MSDQVKTKILIVDDEEDILNTMSMVLEKKGYSVTTASNGVMGLESIRANKPDIVLTDVLMPEMDGLQFYKELKENEKTADLPVLVITARPLMEDSFNALGADGFISKPFTPDDLCQKIEHLLSLRDAREGNRGGINKLIRKKVLITGKKNLVTSEMASLGERAGYKVRVVESGSEIIAETVKYYPDVIILDLHTEELSSEDVITTLRRLPQFGDKPIILYSHYTTRDLENSKERQRVLNIQSISEVCLKAGANQYIGRYNREAFTKALIDELTGPRI